MTVRRTFESGYAVWKGYTTCWFRWIHSGCFGVVTRSNICNIFVFFQEPPKREEKVYPPKPKRYNLNHYVGGRIPAATTPKAKEPKLDPPTYRRVHSSADELLVNADSDFFITPPSVPQYHIPADILRRELKRCSSSVLRRPPRQQNVGTLRDSLHGADSMRDSARWWNDITMWHATQHTRVKNLQTAIQF